jgi:hypothetical protein
MTWIEYMIMAARHSKGNAGHWFRYLRKFIDKCGTSFTMDDVETLYNNESLTPFQRVSIKAAFRDNSPTREYIIRLNDKNRRNIVAIVKDRIEEARR